LTVQPIAPPPPSYSHTPIRKTLLPTPPNIDTALPRPSDTVRVRCSPIGCISPAAPHTNNNLKTSRIQSCPPPS
ncbi:hypothetical protein DM02DRAFT_413464, partial [Periconia macrospinosa]